MVSRIADQDEWRRKYYESLRAVEQESRQNRAQQEILYKLVGRLCLAAQGQSPRLDQHLRVLKDAARKLQPADQLEALSQSIADAVHQLDSGSTGATGSLRVQVDEFNAQPAIDPAPRGASGIFADGDIQVRAVLSRLMEELAHAPPLAAEARAIDAELPGATSEQLPKLIEKVGGLVVQRIAGLEKSRQELELLLGQMMGQLDALTRYIAGQSADESGRTASANALNMQITGEVQAIGQSVEQGTDLGQIRRQLRERLNAISHHLHAYRDREEERARQSRERTESMRARMDQMESEAHRLQAKLLDEKRLSLLDPLTQIPNRLAWEQRFSEECERWKRFHQPTCVAAWDIDQFKAINDNYGHRAGDKVLAVVAESLMKSVRNTDFVARYGGEEFVMLLPGTGLEAAARLANQMRESIAQIGFHFRGQPVSVTISCGITAMQEGDTSDEAFDRADKAMYRAKDAGRNRVVSA